MKNYLHKKVQKYEWRDLRGPSQREVQISIVTDLQFCSKRRGNYKKTCKIVWISLRGKKCFFFFCVMFEKFSEIWANWSKWTLAFGRGDDAAVLYQSNPISTDNKSNDQDHTEVLGKMCQKNWKPNITSVRRSYRQKTNQLETTSDYLTKRAKLKKHPKII